MKTLKDVFDLWDSIPEMAADVGETHWAVSKWYQRKRIPQDAWLRVIHAARLKGKKLTADDLLSMHSLPVRLPQSAVACK